MSVNFVCECLQFMLWTVWQQMDEGIFLYLQKLTWFHHFIVYVDFFKKCELILKGVDCSILFMCPNIECAYQKSCSILQTLDDIKVS